MDAFSEQRIIPLSAGSTWSRWDPHVHAPGTILNDQFKGPNAWEDYLKQIETAAPAVRAIGITDYYSLETYERVRQARTSGRLKNCELIFPNVEMRLDVGTVKGKWANVHLLVSPEDPDHLTELKRFLGRLHFAIPGDTFTCTREELIRLGRASDRTITEEGPALRRGTEQFKVNIDELKEVYKNSDWARANILIAVAGSETDGTSGIRSGSDESIRRKVESFAHIIFASSEAQREFWLGRRSLSEAELRRQYEGLKPCLHGSDAHATEDVGAPDGQRYSWVKGAVSFDALRQACIDPASRAYVGPLPPATATPSQVISRIEVRGTSWAKTPSIDLNPGLVAIIGARGSGKTALADMIAAGCHALADSKPGEESKALTASFVHRARDLLAGAEVRLSWGAGDGVVRALDGSDADPLSYPRARYLSQQFVEDLCSSTGITDELLQEIERVIFESHSMADREGAIDFDELLQLRATRHRLARQREENALLQTSEQIAVELEKEKQIPDLTAQLAAKVRLVTSYTTDRSRLVVKGSEERVAQLTKVMEAADKVRSHVRFFTTSEQALLALQDEVSDHRTNQAPELLRQTQQRHPSTRIKPEEWKAFRLDYAGDVDAQIKKALTDTRANISGWKGTAPSPSTDGSFLVASLEMEKNTLSVLEAEIIRLEKLVNADAETTRKFAAATKKIIEETTSRDRIQEKLDDAKGARERVQQAVSEREAAYTRLFEALVAEQQVLTELYKPLMDRLTAASGTLKKLSFSVARVADTARWSKEAEDNLVDLRRGGPFKGRGSLGECVDETLKKAWETGDAVAVAEAMKRFRELYQDELLEHSKVPKANQADFRAWSKRFAKWLFSTDHISLRYGIEYDGVDIRKLSPGTRGIVLLLLYLALDMADDRPLIIDQPEENLDPQSVFDELVGLFVAAKNQRQVIMVTHNANLVVNTDADQIIVAHAGPHLRGELPDITYKSGGLEEEHIRESVCDILEGGEHAFKERARRLRVRLDR